MLDVVYNHIGPVGNYLGEFSNDYLSPQHQTDWGDAINFDGDQLRPGARVLRLPTPAIGSTSFTSTDCGWTPSTRSSTTRTSTF